MIGLLVGLLLLSWVFGRTRGLLGGLVGGFLGTLVLIGMTSAASNGELAAIYSPAQLLSAAFVMAAAAAVLALVAPYATGFASLGWGVGALLAATAARRTGQAMYILPLAVHIAAAATVVCLAKWRAAAS
ncbi:MAG TPA: hypothetical protein VM307_13790 [Egibacteraceae bacterium]|nr:hypothetical protein [Egibacteraceae bacterium]